MKSRDTQPTAGAQRIPFVLDNHLINHLVYDQSTTVENAILELVMNAIDAGAPAVKVEITAQGFSVTDGGSGFASREDIESFFARFGTPHQTGDAAYGRFRIGRAQIMGFASTLWRSRQFEMRVDVSADAAGFELIEGLEDLPGCTITGTWYPERSGFRYDHADEVLQLQFDATRVHRLCQSIILKLQFPPVGVTINGHVIQTVSNAEWDNEDEFACYRLRIGQDLRVFNQGVFVKELDARIHDVGGIVVTKTALRLNMARNMIQPDCPVWQRIEQEVRGKAASLHESGATTGTKEHRLFLLKKFLQGEAGLDIPIVTILPKRVVTIRVFIGQLGNCDAISFADYGEVVRAENIARRVKVCVLHFEFMELLAESHVGAPVSQQDELIGHFLDAVLMRLPPEEDDWEALTRQKGRSMQRCYEFPSECLRTLPVCCLGDLDPGDDIARGVPDDRLPESLLADLNLVRAVVYRFFSCRRRLYLGDADQAEAWTDGTSAIWFSRRHFKAWMSQGDTGLIHLFDVILHELAHRGPSLNEGHDEAFLNRFHDMRMQSAKDVAKATALLREHRARRSGNPGVAVVWAHPIAPPIDHDPLSESRRLAAATSRMLDRLQLGECTIDEVRRCLDGLQDSLASPSIRDGEFLEQRFVLSPTIRLLFNHYPPDRLPATGFLSRLASECEDLAFVRVSANGSALQVKVVSATQDAASGSPTSGHTELFRSKLLRKGASTVFNGGVPPSVLGSIRTEIQARDELFPWAARSFERDLIWWMAIRGSWQGVVAMCRAGWSLHVRGHHPGRRRIYCYTKGGPADDRGAWSAVTDMDAWLSALSGEVDRDLAIASSRGEEGVFWRRWL